MGRRLGTESEGLEGKGVNVEIAGAPVSPRGSPPRLLDVRLGRPMLRERFLKLRENSRRIQLGRSSRKVVDQV